MFEEMTFRQRSWTQRGVKHVVKEIPNEERVGVFAPETLYALRVGEAQMAAGRDAALKSGDYGALRGMPPPGVDITTQPIRQWEFTVDRDGYAIPITAYCLESAADRAKPAVVYFHGGGWRAGSRRNVESPMRLLAQYSGALVCSVEYRLAPEYRYPVATDDCWRALQYVRDHAAALGADAQSITVGGDSAGGNLAAACARRDRNARAGILRQQVLVYPAVAQTIPDGLADYHFSLDDYEYDDSQAEWIEPSILALGKDMGADPLYAATRDEALLPDASPLLDTDFSGLPRTLILCAEYDFLTQQCRAYARRLAAAGVDVTLVVYRGVKHGFMTRVGRFPQATDLQREFARAVQGR